MEQTIAFRGLPTPLWGRFSICGGLVTRHSRRYASLPPYTERSMDEPTNPPPESVESPYTRDGVDVTLIRWMLDMTPAERLQVLQSFVDATWKARGANDET